MRRILLLSFATFFLSGCNHSHHVIISCCNLDPDSDDHNNIRFLIDSIGDNNSLQFKNDTSKLERYLFPEELSTAFDTVALLTPNHTFVYYKSEFVPIDTLMETDKFVAELILQMNKAERHYSFQIRTYNRHGILSSHEFTVYSDKLKRYCSGDFDRDTGTFTVDCNNISEKYAINEEGKIMRIR